MEYVTLGRTGLKISRLVMGCMTFGSPDWAPWVLGADGTKPILHRALDLGINTFDMADMYSRGACEEIVAATLLAQRPRHSLVLATKIYNPMSDDPNDRGLSRKHVFEAVDGCLRRMQTDYIDLLQLHRFDHETPLEETLDALNDVVRMGKVRYLGASSMFAWQFMKAIGIQRANGWAPFVSMQPHYNLIYREEEREMIPLCQSEGIGVIPWSPLARGRLARPAGQSGTSRAGTDKVATALYGDAEVASNAIIAAVEKVTKKHGVAMASVAYAWVSKRPGITAPIVGISRAEQFDAALAALNLEFDREDLEALESPYRPLKVAGHT